MSNSMNPIPPTDAVGDPQVRSVLDALSQNIRVVRDEYINVDNIGDYTQSALTDVLNGTSKSNLTNAQIYAQILGSELYRKLSEPITLDFQNRILGTIASTQQVADGMQTVAANLAKEAAARLGFETTTGSAIASIQTVNATQATQISGLTTRVDTAESTIINLQSTTSSQATSLTSLTTRVGSAESNITSLQTTTSSQASSLTALATRVTGAESNITSLQTTTASQATSLTSLTTRVGNAESSISTLNTTTANQASSISSLTTSVSNNTAAISSEATTRANQVSALTATTTQLTSAVTDPNTGQIATSSILQEYRTYANAANATFNSSYTLRLNAGNQIVGFGLQATSGAGSSGGYTSAFTIVADSFSLVTPGQSPVVPFTVSSGRAVFNGTLSAVNGTFAGDISAASGTFSGSIYSNKLSGDVNTIVTIAADYGGGYISSGSWTTIGTATLPGASHPDGHTPSAIVTVFMARPGGGSGAVRLLVDGSELSVTHSYLGAVATLVVAGSTYRRTGATTFTLQAQGTSGADVSIGQIRGYLIGVR